MFPISIVLPVVKIVSLLPSATEVICAQGLQPSLVGVTHECDWPVGITALPKVTKTLIPHDASSIEIDGLVRERLKESTALYSLEPELLETLKPDLIVTQSLCDVCAVAEDEVKAVAASLSSKPTVINLEPSCLSDVYDCVIAVGQAADCVERANVVVQGLKDRVEAVSKRSQTISDLPSVVVLEWIDPPFSAGHWTPELVRLAGGMEMIGRPADRSITTPWQSILDADPDVLVIACCGFTIGRTLQDLPILKSNPGWSDLRCVQSQRVYVVDGSAYFSRPGPRLVDSVELLAATLHPAIHPLPDFLEPATQVDVSE